MGNKRPFKGYTEFCNAAENIDQLWLDCETYFANCEQELDAAKKRIVELEQEMFVWKKNAEENSKHACSYVHTFSGRCLKPETTPVAKQIVWCDNPNSTFSEAEFGQLCFKIERMEKYECFQWRVHFSHNLYIYDYANSLELAKQAVQKWLNKLVAECAVAGNPLTQFTTEEIETIRQSLINESGSWFEHGHEKRSRYLDMLVDKCDTILKGAEG